MFHAGDSVVFLRVSSLRFAAEVEIKNRNPIIGPWLADPCELIHGS